FGALERLQKFDQRPLVLIGERLFFLEKARAEIVTLIDDVIGTFTDLDQIGNEIFEHLSGFRVSLALDSLEIFFHLEQEAGEIELVGLEIDGGAQTDLGAAPQSDEPEL